MRRRARLDRRGCMAALALGLGSVATVCGPARTRGGEWVEVVRGAFEASSAALVSGVGKGMYRYYESRAGGDWVLVADADLSVCFARKKYLIELRYHPPYEDLSCRRIMYDGKGVKTSWFPPGWRTRGQTRNVATQDFGNGVHSPGLANFPWDPAQLLRNICDLEGVIHNVIAAKLHMEETREGDLVGTYPVRNADRVRIRFVCLKKFAFNIARQQVFVGDEPRPVQEHRLEWKCAPEGCWYVSSVQEEFAIAGENRRYRRLLRYEVFNANIPVDPLVFTDEALRAPLNESVFGTPGATPAAPRRQN
jgi:hypothetical protein